MTGSDAKLGILMLDTRFPRVPGDVGNPDSFDFPVRYGVVPGATPEAIVCDDPAPFVDAFVSEGRALIAAGCTGIATTCGFLSVLRPQLAKALGVPVAASALEQLAQIDALMPQGKRAGIMTISAESLTAEHLRVAGAAADTPIIGMEGSHFATAILGNAPSLDTARAGKEMVETARHFAEMRPELGAILLECTNMPPYAADVAAVTGLPVYSILGYLNWFHAGLLPHDFPVRP